MRPDVYKYSLEEARIVAVETIVGLNQIMKKYNKEFEKGEYFETYTRFRKVFEAQYWYESIADEKQVFNRARIKFINKRLGL